MRFSRSIPAVLVVLFLCMPFTAWGANLLNTTSFINSAGESCVKRSFDDGSDTIECVGTSEVEIIDVPVPELPPLPSGDPVPEGGGSVPEGGGSVPEGGGSTPEGGDPVSGGTATPTPTTSSPKISKPKKTPGQKTIEADQERTRAKQRNKGKTGYDDVETTDDEDKDKKKPEQDWGALDKQIKRLGGFVLPSAGGEEVEEEKEECTNCKFRIVRVLHRLRGLEVPTGPPSIKINDLNWRTPGETEQLLKDFKELMNDLDLVVSMVGLGGNLIDGNLFDKVFALLQQGEKLLKDLGLVDGSVPYESAGGEKLSTTGAMVDAIIDALGGQGNNFRHIKSIEFSIPYVVVDAWHFEAFVCEGGNWYLREGLYIKKGEQRDFGKDIAKREAEKYVGGRGGSADRAIEAATAQLMKWYKKYKDNLAKFDKFLLKIKRDNSICKVLIGISEGSFRGVPEGPAAQPEEKPDCSTLKQQFLDAVREESKLMKAYEKLIADLPFLKKQKAEADQALADARAAEQEAKAKANEGASRDSLRRQAATARSQRNFDELERINDQLGQIEAATNAWAESRRDVKRWQGIVNDRAQELSNKEAEISKAVADISAIADTIDKLREAYLKCKEAGGTG